MNHIPDGLQAFWVHVYRYIYIYIKNSSVDVKIEIHYECGKKIKWKFRIEAREMFLKKAKWSYINVFLYRIQYNMSLRNIYDNETFCRIDVWKLVLSHH